VILLFSESYKIKEDWRKAVKLKYSFQNNTGGIKLLSSKFVLTFTSFNRNNTSEISQYIVFNSSMTGKVKHNKSMEYNIIIGMTNNNKIYID